MEGRLTFFCSIAKYLHIDATISRGSSMFCGRLPQNIVSVPFRIMIHSFLNKERPT